MCDPADEGCASCAPLRPNGTDGPMGLLLRGSGAGVVGGLRAGARRRVLWPLGRRPRRMGAYSFYPTKNLGAIGDGGALVTKNAEVAATAKRLRNYGQEDRYRHTVLGLNSRLDEVQAAILTVRLAWLENWIMRRRRIAKAYSEGISNPRVVTPPLPEDLACHVFHLFVLRCTGRDALIRHLAERGVNTLVHYPVPVHLQPVCLDVARDPEGLPNAERHARECLSLPCHPQMSDEAIRYVMDAINSFAS